MHYPSRRASKSPDESEDVLIRVDRRTAEMLKLVSDELEFSMKEVLRWLVWMGRKSLGRKVKIEGEDKTIEMSLEEYKKLSKLDLD